MATVDRAPPTDRATLKRITAEWVDLYSYVPSLGKSIPIFRQASPGGRLGSYGGRDQVVREISLEEQLQGPVGDEGEARKRMARVVEAEEARAGRGRGR